MTRPPTWAVATAIVLATTAGCNARPPTPPVTTTCAAPITNPSAHNPVATTATGCTSLEFTAAGTYTVTVKFITPAADASIDYTLVGAGGGGGRGPGPGGGGSAIGPSTTGGGGGGGGGAGTTITASGTPLPASTDPATLTIVVGVGGSGGIGGGGPAMTGAKGHDGTATTLRGDGLALTAAGGGGGTAGQGGAVGARGGKGGPGNPPGANGRPGSQGTAGLPGAGGRAAHGSGGAGGEGGAQPGGAHNGMLGQNGYAILTIRGATAVTTLITSSPGFFLVTMAEADGFEPPVLRTTLASTRARSRASITRPY